MTEFATIYDFDTLVQRAGMTPRPYQADLAGLVGAALDGGAPLAVAVQAGTGVGKSWALAHPALRSAALGRRVIWSTHTLLLRAQVLATLRQAHDAAGGAAAGLPLIAERRGRADYVSASRALRLRHALAGRRGPAETLDVLDALSA
jgi:Rad3-related DNA helicase